MKYLGWRPIWDLDTAVARTAAWYQEFMDSGELRTALDIEKYVADATDKELAWAS